jgi:hypothetical protein
MNNQINWLLSRIDGLLNYLKKMAKKIEEDIECENLLG